MPVRLVIPRIGVDAAIEMVGIEPDGSMATPQDPWNTAWYAPGIAPGRPGNAAITGHVDYRGIGPVVFWDLRQLVPGDDVLVVTDTGLRLRFTVRSSVRYTPDTAPMQSIFGPADTPNLNLITCIGVYDRAAREYDQRLVVYTTYAGWIE